MVKTIIEYEKDFKDYIINNCTYESSEKEYIERCAKNEYESHIESVKLEHIDFNDGAADADECMSCWEE